MASATASTSWRSAAATSSRRPSRRLVTQVAGDRGAHQGHRVHPALDHRSTNRRSEYASAGGATVVGPPPPPHRGAAAPQGRRRGQRVRLHHYLAAGQRLRERYANSSSVVSPRWSRSWSAPVRAAPRRPIPGEQSRAAQPRHQRLPAGGAGGATRAYPSAEETTTGRGRPGRRRWRRVAAPGPAVHRPCRLDPDRAGAHALRSASRCRRRSLATTTVYPARGATRPTRAGPRAGGAGQRAQARFVDLVRSVSGWSRSGSIVCWLYERKHACGSPHRCLPEGACRGREWGEGEVWWARDRTRRGAVKGGGGRRRARLTAVPARSPAGRVRWPARPSRSRRSGRRGQDSFRLC